MHKYNISKFFDYFKLFDMIYIYSQVYVKKIQNIFNKIFTRCKLTVIISATFIFVLLHCKYSYTYVFILIQNVLINILYGKRHD